MTSQNSDMVGLTWNPGMDICRRFQVILMRAVLSTLCKTIEYMARRQLIHESWQYERPIASGMGLVRPDRTKHKEVMFRNRSVKVYPFWSTYFGQHVPALNCQFRFWFRQLAMEWTEELLNRAYIVHCIRTCNYWESSVLEVVLNEYITAAFDSVLPNLDQ